MIPDQATFWDRKHAKGDHEHLRLIPSPFAEVAAPFFPEHADLLELGCGVGRDALYFANLGHRVLATDAASSVIEQDRELYGESTVSFSVLDIRAYEPTRLFDVVYANLALHYFTDEVTRQIVSTVAASLVDGGIFAFACKSEDNDRTDGATEVEEGVFVAPNGHALHLFSRQYAQDLLSGLFSIVLLEEVAEEYQGKTSKIIQCIARKQ